MTGMAFVAVVIIAAITGSLTALITEAMREASRTWDAGMDRISREIDAERAHTHTWIGYSNYRFCTQCGEHQAQPFDVERDGAL